MSGVWRDQRRPVSAEVTQPVQYGSRLQAVAAYLKNYGLLPYQRTVELFEGLFSLPISVGTLVNINDSLRATLGGDQRDHPCGHQRAAGGRLR